MSVFGLGGMSEGPVFEFHGLGKPTLESLSRGRKSEDDEPQLFHRSVSAPAECMRLRPSPNENELELQSQRCYVRLVLGLKVVPEYAGTTAWRFLLFGTAAVPFRKRLRHNA